MDNENNYVKKNKEFMIKLLDPRYEAEAMEWLASLGIIKRGAHHGLILQRDERLIEAEETEQKDKPRFLQRLLHNEKSKDQLSR